MIRLWPPCSARQTRLTFATLLVAIAACAPRQAPEQTAGAAKRPPPPYVSRKVLVRVPPTPSHTRPTALDEQSLGEGLELPPELPPAAVDPRSDLEESLAPQIKSAKSPNVAAALRLVDEGRALLGQERFDQARSRFEQSVSIDPSSFYGYYYLARLSYVTQAYSQAAAFANRATALGAGAERAWLGRAYALQGEIFEKVGRFPDARTAYQRAVETDPTNLTAYVGRARVSPQQPQAPKPDEDPWR
jgi:tetratricopeptide (TPR) repeat protein